MSLSARNSASRIFTDALATCTVEAATGRSLRRDGKALWAGEREYDLDRFSEATVIALGKAAASLFDAVVPLVDDVLPVRAVVSAPRPLKRTGTGTEFFAGGHPFPNDDSLRAGHAALALAGAAGPETLVLFLISGGGSSMMEALLDPGIPLADLAAFYRWLVGSGLDIRAINTLRKRLSAVKGGRLAEAAAGAGARLSLLVSDVPDGALDTLASGPTLPDASTADDVRRLLRDVPASALPANIRHALENAAETPKADDAYFRNAGALLLLSNATLLEAAAANARKLGYEPVVDIRCDDWDVRDAAAYLLDRFHTLQQANPQTCLLSGGEVTVRLPQRHGAGGRNSQFALECARLLHERNAIATVLSAGSDGVDGLSPAAGARADETTWRRAHNPQAALDGFDAYTLFAGLGDAVVTGPTGNNLRDLRILLPSTD